MSKKITGFTLVEMLIVVGIIAILASIVLIGLAPSRLASRDARRVADLRQIQGLIELYYNACGSYPGGGTTTNANCKTSAVVDTTANPGNQTLTNLTAALSKAGVLSSSNVLPLDPLDDATYHYKYAGDGGSGQSYTLAAPLENPTNQAFANSLTGTLNGNIVCNGTTGVREYCVGQ